MASTNFFVRLLQRFDCDGSLVLEVLELFVLIAYWSALVVVPVVNFAAAGACGQELLVDFAGDGVGQ